MRTKAVSWIGVFVVVALGGSNEGCSDERDDEGAESTSSAIIGGTVDRGHPNVGPS